MNVNIVLIAMVLIALTILYRNLVRLLKLSDISKSVRRFIRVGFVGVIVTLGSVSWTMASALSLNPPTINELTKINGNINTMEVANINQIPK